MTLRWPGEDWRQSLDGFTPGSRTIRYGAPAAAAAAGGFDLESVFQAIRPFLSPRGAAALDDWAHEARKGNADWSRFGQAFSP